MTNMSEISQGRDSGLAGAVLDSHDSDNKGTTLWVCEKWSQEAVEYCQRKLEHDDVRYIQDGCIAKPTGRLSKVVSAALGRPIEETIAVPRLIPIQHGITSDILRKVVGEPEECAEIQGNLLLNEGIQLLLNLSMVASGLVSNQVATNYWSNTNAYVGVGTSSTAEAATQTELQGTQDSSNRFYKVMVATYPIRTNQSVDFRSDFTSAEANFAWNEWTVSAGATTASGGGFLVGTTNLNRKVQSLGTKSTGTWTMTGTVTIS